MKLPVLFLMILSFFISCAGNSDTNTSDVSDDATSVNVTEVDSVEIKRLADEAAAKAAEAEKMALLEEERLQAEKDSIEQAEKKLAEAKAKKAKEEKRKKEAAARAAAEAAAKPASIPVSELPVSQPVVKPAPKPAPKKRAQITFAKKNYNFGTIKEGDVVKYEFEYTNTGTADLVIKDASASCGCTAPGFSFFPLEPGLSSAISVTFNSQNKLGAQRPQITIKTNGYPSTHILTLEGVVEK